MREKQSAQKQSKKAEAECTNKRLIRDDRKLVKHETEAGFNWRWGNLCLQCLWSRGLTEKPTRGNQMFTLNCLYDVTRENKVDISLKTPQFMFI